MARHEHSWGVTSVEGFEGNDKLLTPGFLAALCYAGCDINDLAVRNVIGTDNGTEVGHYVTRFVSALELGKVTKVEDKPSGKYAYPNSVSDEVDAIFNHLKTLPSPRSTVVNVPIVDIGGHEKNLIIVAVSGAAGRLSVGLHTESIGEL